MNDPWDERESGVTVRELIRQLQMQNPDNYVCFGYHGHFTFERVKDRGGLTQIEFSEFPGDTFVLTDRHPYMKYKAEKHKGSS